MPAVTPYYVPSLPLTAAVLLGRWVNRRLDGLRFVRTAHVGLVVIGVTLEVPSVWR